MKKEDSFLMYVSHVQQSMIQQQERLQSTTEQQTAM